MLKDIMLFFAYFAAGMVFGVLYMLFCFLKNNVFNKRNKTYEFSGEAVLPDDVDSDMLQHNRDQESSKNFK